MKPKIVYKSAHDCIITMELLEYSNHNMDRMYIVDAPYAKYRCDKVRVISICNKFTDEEMSQINSNYDENFIYKVGSIIFDQKYNTDENEIRTEGIHFFLNYESAFFYKLNTRNYTGIYKTWHRNGQLKIECNYRNGKIDGLYKQWYENGKLHTDCNYVNGKLDGLYFSWHKSSQFYVQYSSYMNMQNDGLCGERRIDGQLSSENNYIDGVKHGLCKKWSKDGNIISECKYKYGVKEIIRRTLFRNMKKFVMNKYLYKDEDSCIQII